MYSVLFYASLPGWYQDGMRTRPPVEAGISLVLDLETGRLNMTIRNPDVLEQMEHDAAAEGFTLDEYMQHMVNELAKQYMQRDR